MTIDIANSSIAEKQAWLVHAIGPRPIALASTIDKNGNVNLSPFSFFNLFSYEPPVIIFAPLRSVRTRRQKHSLLNVLEVPEVVINICDDAMVQQVSLSSCEYPKDVDEFVKAGFTKEPSILVKPPMVKEAKIKFECKVTEVKSLGDNGGAGQLIIAEISLMHVHESILNDQSKNIDQTKMHHIARLGGNWYAVINKLNLFTVTKPVAELGVGIDSLPAGIKNSSILTGNHLGQLANVHALPLTDISFNDDYVNKIMEQHRNKTNEVESELHRYAAKLLNENRLGEAWQVLLIKNKFL